MPRKLGSQSFMFKDFYGCLFLGWQCENNHLSSCGILWGLFDGVILRQKNNSINSSILKYLVIGDEDY